MMKLKFNLGDLVACILREGEEDDIDGDVVWGQAGEIVEINEQRNQPYCVDFEGGGCWWILESSIALVKPKKKIPTEELICNKIKELIAKQAKIKAAKEKWRSYV
jgi:hypothetical protein